MINCQLLLSNGRVLPAQIFTYAAGEFGVRVDPSTSVMDFPPDKIVSILIDQERKVELHRAYVVGPWLTLIDQGPALDNGPET